MTTANRDAKGRFCRKEEVKRNNATKKTAKTAKKEVKPGDELLEALTKLRKQMDAGEIGCGVVGVKLDGSYIKPEDVMDCLDKVFEIDEPSTKSKEIEDAADTVGLLGAFKTLLSAEGKLNKQEAVKGTPIEWELADPMWVADLHDIYAEGCIPETEEGLREDILTAVAEAHTLIGGYLFYLDHKKTSCQCKGKCK